MANPCVVAKALSFELLGWTFRERGGNDLCQLSYYKLACPLIVTMIGNI